MAATALALTLALAAQADGREQFALGDGLRVVFLGDSITYAGMFVQQVDAYVATRFPGRRVELIDLGLPSETASGLSEPGHPFPRPDVRERLGRALEKTRPGLVVVCYGMNDGIYHPYDEGRASAYRAAMLGVVEAIKASGAEVLLLTPPPFDPVPIRDRLAPEGAAEYGYQSPYANYDATLAAYAAWVLSLRDRGVAVVDARGAVAGLLAGLRADDPAATLAPDGIHLDATGHWAIARALLEHWKAPADVDAAAIDAARGVATEGRVEGIERDGRSLRFAWTTRVPMPRDPRLRRGQGPADRLNRHRLAVAGLEADEYDIFEDDRPVGRATRGQLAAGIDLLGLPELSTNRRAAAIWPKLEARERALSGAWLDEVGHTRPDTAKGLPLDEARRRADALSAEIRELAEPRPIRLRLVSVGE